jgi:hypothetical protein
LTTAETFMICITHDCVLPFPDCWFSVRLSRFVYSPRYWQPTTIRVCRNIWESPPLPSLSDCHLERKPERNGISWASPSGEVVVHWRRRWRTSSFFP